MSELIQFDKEHLLTEAQLKRVMPKSMRMSNVSGLLDTVNSAIIGGDEIADGLRDNVLGFSSVLRDGVYKATDYVNAVKFVSYRMLGKTTVEAYASAFPDRFQRLVDKGTSNKDIGSMAGAYARGVLVNKIIEQTLVPSHIVNNDIFQEAINTQATIMRDPAVSAKVRSDAATSLIVNLKMPVATKLELDVNLKPDKSLDDLRETVKALTAVQKEALDSGVDVKTIAHSKLVDSDTVEDAEYTE